MYIYIDKSGNSGININDASQPYFYTLSLISESDFENKMSDDAYPQKSEL